MRPQYHFRKVGSDVQIWDVHKLVQLSAQYEAIRFQLADIADIAELDENHWFDDETATPRLVAQHAKLNDEADLTYPIILDSSGRVMDGMHRICKALLMGLREVSAVQFPIDPAPDYTNVRPEDLPYD